MKRYAGFLLDADNTLFDYDRGEAEALEETFREALPDVPRRTAHEAYRRINAGYWKALEQGTVTFDELKVARFADLLAELHAGGDARAVSETYLGALSCKAYFLPHARQAVERLSRVARLCLITNGLSRVQRGRLKASGIEGCFASVLISEELGVAKPDPRFFDAACGTVGLPRPRILCIGDNPVADVEGARASGIDACWYCPSGQDWPGPGAPPQYIIRDCEEFIIFAGVVYP